jgi:hypothetical protein
VDVERPEVVPHEGLEASVRDRRSAQVDRLDAAEVDVAERHGEVVLQVEALLVHDAEQGLADFGRKSGKKCRKCGFEFKESKVWMVRRMDIRTPLKDQVHFIKLRLNFF